MDLKVIRTDDDHRAAIERLTQLAGAEPETVTLDELEVLATLVSAYEAKRWPVGVVDAVSAIRFRMEQQGLTEADLAPYLGSASRAAEVLAGRRALSLTMIRRLHYELGIPTDALLQPPARRRPAKAEPPKPARSAQPGRRKQALPR